MVLSLWLCRLKRMARESGDNLASCLHECNHLKQEAEKWDAPTISLECRILKIEVLTKAGELDESMAEVCQLMDQLKTKHALSQKYYHVYANLLKCEI